MGREAPDLVVTGARILSTYTERILPDARGLDQVAAGSRPSSPRAPAGRRKGSRIGFFDARGGIVAPGLVDPHIHIESSMMTACAYAEPALLNGTTTIFCDSHEIGNVCDARGIEWMLEDARRAPLSIFLTVPSTVPATGPRFETAGRRPHAARRSGGSSTAGPRPSRSARRWISCRWRWATAGATRSSRRPSARPARLRATSTAANSSRPGAASGITDTHEAIDREIADDFLENGVWVFLRGGPPTTPWNSLPLAIKAVTELGANPKRVCVCTDDRDADDLFLFGMDWVVRCRGQGGHEAGRRPGAWAPSTRRRASGWTARSAAWPPRGAPTWCFSTTRSSRSAPGTAASSSSGTAG